MGASVLHARAQRARAGGRATGPGEKSLLGAAAGGHVEYSARRSRWPRCLLRRGGLLMSVFVCQLTEVMRVRTRWTVPYDDPGLT
jgi:hypothetical protein